MPMTRGTDRGRLLALGPTRRRRLHGESLILKALTSVSSNELIRRINPAWVAVVLIAAAYAALAYSNGGYSSELIAVVTIAVWWIVIVGLAARVFPRRPIPPLAVAAGACLAAFGGLTALSMIWANDAGGAFTEVVRVAGYLGLFVLTVLVSARTGARPWLVGIMVGLVVVVGGALLSRFDPSLFGGADRSIFAALPASNGRLSYPVGYWNGLAACIAFGILLLGWFSAQGTSRLGRAAATGLLPAFGLALYLTSSRGGIAAVVVGGCALLVFSQDRARMLVSLALGGLTSALLVLYASQRDDLAHALTTHDAYVQGREVAVATVLCVVVAAAVRYVADGRLRRLRISRTAVLRGLAAVFAAALVVFALSHPLDRIREFADANDVAGASAATGAGHLTASSGTGRYQFWDQAIAAFESDPVIGIGAGNYEMWWNQHHTIDVITMDAHSLYLQTLGELGILGLLLLLGFLGTSLFAGWRAVARRPDMGERHDVMAVALALFLAGLTSAAFDWTWQLPAAFVPVIVMAALLTGPATQPVAVVAEPGVPRGVPRWRARGGQYGLGVATLACAWVAIWVAGDQLVASIQLDNSRGALENGDLEGAAQSANNASAIQPWSSEAQLQLALVEKERGDLVAASEAVHKAIDRASQDWQAWLVAAEIAAAAGNRRGAEFGLAAANRLSPRPLPVKLVPER
jgi:hypothetical protein